MNKFTLTIFVLLLVSQSFAQSYTGTLKGKITDEETLEGLISATIVIYSSGTEIAVAGGVTDIEGNYSIRNIQAGEYDIEISYVGYSTVKVENVKLIGGEVTIIDRTLKEGITMNEVIVDTYMIHISHASYSSYTRIIQKQELKQTSGRKRNKKRFRLFGFKKKNVTLLPTNESYARIEENPFKNTRREPLSTFSVDVDRASYSNVRRHINNGTLPPKDAVRIEEMLNYFQYEKPEIKDEHPIGIQTEYANCPWNTQHKLLKVSLAAKSIDKNNLPASNLVFLLDVSGSMHASNKLPLVKSALKILVEQLGEEDKIAIVVYAGAAGLVLPSTSCNNKDKILEAINKLEAGGSTAGGAGIELAYKVAQEQFIQNGNNRVILATDGDFNVGASTDRDMESLIEEKRETGIFLTCLGFGMGNYKDSKLEILADKGNGNYAFIDQWAEAQKMFGAEFTGTMFTLAKDVKLQLEFNPRNVAAYRLIGYENRVLNHEDFDNDAVDAGEIGAEHQVTALYEIIPNGVESSFLPTTNKLKYQRQRKKRKYTQELLTVKFRYKKPKGWRSTLLKTTVKNRIKEPSQDFQFAASVAMFGMILRDSDYLNSASYEDILKLAKANLGEDKNGYRIEMVDLIEMAADLADMEETESSINE